MSEGTFNHYDILMTTRVDIVKREELSISNVNSQFLLQILTKSFVFKDLISITCVVQNHDFSSFICCREMTMDPIIPFVTRQPHKLYRFESNS